MYRTTCKPIFIISKILSLFQYKVNTKSPIPLPFNILLFVVHALLVLPPSQKYNRL